MNSKFKDFFAMEYMLAHAISETPKLFLAALGVLMGLYAATVEGSLPFVLLGCTLALNASAAIWSFPMSKKYRPNESSQSKKYKVFSLLAVVSGIASLLCGIAFWYARPTVIKIIGNDTNVILLLAVGTILIITLTQIFLFMSYGGIVLRAQVEESEIAYNEHGQFFLPGEIVSRNRPWNQKSLSFIPKQSQTGSFEIGLTFKDDTLYGTVSNILFEIDKDEIKKYPVPHKWSSLDNDQIEKLVKKDALDRIRNYLIHKSSDYTLGDFISYFSYKVDTIHKIKGDLPYTWDGKFSLQINMAYNPETVKKLAAPTK